MVAAEPALGTLWSLPSSRSTIFCCILVPEYSTMAAIARGLLPRLWLNLLKSPCLLSDSVAGQKLSNDASNCPDPRLERVRQFVQLAAVVEQSMLECEVEALNAYLLLSVRAWGPRVARGTSRGRRRTAKNRAITGVVTVPTLTCQLSHPHALKCVCQHS